MPTSLASDGPSFSLRVVAALCCSLGSSCALIGYRTLEEAPHFADADGATASASEAGAHDADVALDRDAQRSLVGAPSDAGAHDADVLDAGDPGSLVLPEAGLDVDAASALEPPLTFPIDDAGSTSVPDATAPTIPDAAVDAGAAGAADAGADAGSTGGGCAGASALGMCWYLGAFGASCETTCANHGGFDSRSIVRVGTTRQGGHYGDCWQALSSLGFLLPPLRAYRTDAYGLGCHMWLTGALYWLDDPSADFTEKSAGPYARIACACLR